MLAEYMLRVANRSGRSRPNAPRARQLASLAASLSHLPRNTDTFFRGGLRCVVATIPSDRVATVRASIFDGYPRPTVNRRYDGSAGRSPRPSPPGAAVRVALAPAAVCVRDRDLRTSGFRAVLVRGAARGRGRTRRCSRQRGSNANTLGRQLRCFAMIPSGRGTSASCSIK